MTNPIQVLELELLIENLTKRGISVNAMAEALGVNRGNFYSWRRSTKKQIK
jgi:transposase-like protein